MDQFFPPAFLFLLASAIVLFLPGYSLVCFIERKNRLFTPLEQIVLAVASSLLMVDALMLGFDVLGLPLRVTFLLPVLLGVSGIILLLARRGRAWPTAKQEAESRVTGTGSIHAREPFQDFVNSRRTPVAFLVLFIALVVLKTIYFLPAVVPNSTDLGHHMYWVKKIVLEEKLPEYTKRDIVERDKMYTLGEPVSLSDFIVGEHLALSLIQMISRMEFTSVAPALTLFLIHLITMIAVYALTLRLFAYHRARESIALIAFLLVGFLFAFAPPQMKYVLGGVVGNTLGNLFIPAIFLLLLIALRAKRADVLALAILLMFGLAYTHHLSTLLFALMLTAASALLVIFDFRRFRNEVLPLFWRPPVLLTLALSLVFFFFIWTPSYIQNRAVQTVIGTATNAENLGLSVTALKFAVGEPRMVFGLFGLGLLLTLRTIRRSDTAAVLLGWTLPLLLLSLRADLVALDLPSARVANYLIAPLTIAAAFALVWIWEQARAQIALPRWLGVGSVLVIFVFILHNGILDNTQYLISQKERVSETRSLLRAADYLANTVPPDAMVVHDHVNIVGDSWIKLAFMRDYNYPLYRANFFRYDRIQDKQEKCTLAIISTPNTENALRCIRELDVRAILVNETRDGQQFRRFQNYSLIYNDEYYSVYRYVSR